MSRSSELLTLGWPPVEAVVARVEELDQVFPIGGGEGPAGLSRPALDLQAKVGVGGHLRVATLVQALAMASDAMRLVEQRAARDVLRARRSGRADNESGKPPVFHGAIVVRAGGLSLILVKHPSRARA